MSIVTLTTDFGTRDGYVGEMKGVVLTREPSARLVDVTHEISPGAIREGAWALSRIWSLFPAGTVHLAVVDPGVGGERRAVAARIDRRWFVGPDNGLLTRVLDREPVEAVRTLDPATVGRKPLSDTFHGRDLFAPAAASLVGEADPAEVGPAGDETLVRFPTRQPERTGGADQTSGAGEIRGEVVHVDRFGNLVTNVPSEWLPAEPSVEVGARTVDVLARSFTAVAPGEPVLTRGSGGTLEVSVRDGRASEVLGAGTGDPVVVRQR